MNWLTNLARREDRARLAALRRGVGRRIGDAPEVDRIVLSALPAGIPRWAIDDYWLCATLFALAPEVRRDLSFPRALRHLASADSGAAPGLGRRVQAVLSAPREDLARPLQGLVLRAGRGGQAWDWTGLLRDIRHWDHPERFVQRRWAIDFWGPTEDEDPIDNKPTEA